MGDAQLLERRAGRMAGVRIYPGLLLQHLWTRFLFDETGLKPIARQALAAVEACRELVGRNTKGISAITVGVPYEQGRVIDHPGWPSNRMQSIASVQYQVALALVSPELVKALAFVQPYAAAADWTRPNTTHYGSLPGDPQPAA